MNTIIIFLQFIVCPCFNSTFLYRKYYHYDYIEYNKLNNLLVNILTMNLNKILIDYFKI